MIRKRSIVPAILAIAIFSLCACGTNTKSFAYIHDPETEILSLSDDGKAVYKGSNYKYKQDDSFITLTSSDGTETKMRYIPDDKDPSKMTLYEKVSYNYQGEGSPSGVIGVWVDDNGRSSFQFTEKGTFAEDNFFYGHFIVDENEKTVKLMYDEPMEDTILYYSIEDGKLIIDYPWPMVQTGGDGGVVDKGSVG